MVDGSGWLGAHGSVAVRGDRIEAVTQVSEDAVEALDADGLVLCPGFVDPHSHADMTLFRYPLAENLVMQGITTFAGGQCGSSSAPVGPGGPPDRRALPGVDVTWKTFGDYLAEAMKSGASGFTTGLEPIPAEFASYAEIVALARVAARHGGICDTHVRHNQSHWPTDDPPEDRYGLYHCPIGDV